MSLIKQSLQANSAVMKDPEQDTGTEHLPHDSEQHEMKNNIAGMGYRTEGYFRLVDIFAVRPKH